MGARVSPYVNVRHRDERIGLSGVFTNLYGESLRDGLESVVASRFEFGRDDPGGRPADELFEHERRTR
jgi:hypothetical protein